MTGLSTAQLVSRSSLDDGVLDRASQHRAWGTQALDSDGGDKGSGKSSKQFGGCDCTNLWLTHSRKAHHCPTRAISGDFYTNEYEGYMLSMHALCMHLGKLSVHDEYAMQCCCIRVLLSTCLKTLMIVLEIASIC